MLYLLCCSIVFNSSARPLNLTISYSSKQKIFATTTHCLSCAITDTVQIYFYSETNWTSISRHRSCENHLIIVNGPGVHAISSILTQFYLAWWKLGFRKSFFVKRILTCISRQVDIAACDAVVGLSSFPNQVLHFIHQRFFQVRVDLRFAVLSSNVITWNVINHSNKNPRSFSEQTDLVIKRDLQFSSKHVKVGSKVPLQIKETFQQPRYFYCNSQAQK